MSKFHPFSLRIGSRLLNAGRPLVAGIINVTPDSFFAGSRTSAADEIMRRAGIMAEEGVDIIDIGACSTRPGADVVSADEEMRRLDRGISSVLKVIPDAVVSVDTFRADVARNAIRNQGAHIINDISGGLLDAGMFATVADLQVPYILMHMRGTPATMQGMCDYPHGVVAGVIAELSGRIAELEEMGVADIIIDPGFGFAKTLGQNYELMNGMPLLAELWNRPLLVGISRKSMITKALGIKPDDALLPTTALHMAALERGASLLRVHDVRAARQACDLFMRLADSSNCQTSAT